VFSPLKILRGQDLNRLSIEHLFLLRAGAIRSTWSLDQEGLGAPLMDPFLHWLLTAVVALVAGLAGGVGGRALWTRLQFTAVWDAIEALSSRLSKREGSAGRQASLGKQAELEALMAQLKATAAARQTQQPPAASDALDEVEGLRAAQRIFAVPKEKGGTG
jgi:uncharacterized membrane protein